MAPNPILPMPTILSLSLQTFGLMCIHQVITSASSRSPLNEPLPLELVLGTMGAVSFLIGIFTFFAYIKDKTAMKSLIFSFIGVNAGFAWLFYWVNSGQRIKNWLISLLPVYVGLLAGVWADGEEAWDVGDGGEKFANAGDKDGQKEDGSLEESTL